MSRIETLLRVTNEEKEAVLKKFDKTFKDLNFDVNLLKKWLIGQPHLPQDIDERFLQILLVRNKFKMEKTKQKIVSYYTLKNKYKMFFDINTANPKGQDMEELIESGYMVPLPSLSPDGHRYTLYKLRDPESSPSAVTTSTLILLYTDFEMRFDFSLGDVLIYDLDGFKFSKWLLYDKITIYKLFKLFKDGYSGRIACIHFLNPPFFMNLIYALFRLLVKPDRIKMHHSLASLLSCIPQKYLPSDYGGEQGFLEDLQNDWRKEFEVQMPFIKKMFAETANERLRPKFDLRDGILNKLWS